MRLLLQPLVVDHTEAWQSISLGRALWVSLLPQKREPNPPITAVRCTNLYVNHSSLKFGFLGDILFAKCAFFRRDGSVWEIFSHSFVHSEHEAAFNCFGNQVTAHSGC